MKRQDKVTITKIIQEDILAHIVKLKRSDALLKSLKERYKHNKNNYALEAKLTLCKEVHGKIRADLQSLSQILTFVKSS